MHRVGPELGTGDPYNSRRRATSPAPMATAELVCFSPPVPDAYMPSAARICCGTTSASNVT
jgi:hypothetical protein